MGVSPVFTNFEEGIGGTINRGVAGLIHALQVKEQLDRAEEQFQLEQQEFALRQEQQKQNKMLGDAQVAQMRFNQKQHQTEVKNRSEEFGQMRAALGDYGRYVTAGGDEKAFSQIMTEIDDPVRAQAFTRMVTDSLQMRANFKDLNRSEAPAPRYTPVQTMGPDGSIQIGAFDPRTGTIKPTGQQSGTKPGTVTEDERRSASLFRTADQGMRDIETLVGKGYSPLNENVVSRAAQFAGMDRLSRAASSPEGRLYRNAVKRIVTSYLYTVSGANANPREIDNQAEQQTTDILDSPMTFQQKLDYLRGSVDAIRSRAGRAIPQNTSPVPVRPDPNDQSVRLQNLMAQPAPPGVMSFGDFVNSEAGQRLLQRQGLYR